MALILRACVLAPKIRCLAEFKILGRNITNVKCTSNVLQVRKFAPISQAKEFSSSGTRSETQPLIVYEGYLRKEVFYLKLFSLVTTVASIMCQPFIYSKAQELNDTMLVYGTMSALFVIACTTPLLLHTVTKKYVTEIRYDETTDKYTAETITLLVRRRQIEFTPDDFVIPDVPGLFASCTIKGIPFFVDDNSFKDHGHLVKILGYDKPIDFKLGKPVEFKMNPHSINANTSEHSDRNKG